MKTIQLKLYSFQELEIAAKANALTAYRHLNTDFDWWQDEYDAFASLCSCLGITLKKDSIRFSGFYSQGDGSGFSAKVDIAALCAAIRRQAWKDYAPTPGFDFREPDTDRRVLALVKGGLLPDKCQIISTVRYYDVIADLGIQVVTASGKARELLFEELEKLEAWLQQIVRLLNRHLYQSLENAYEYLISDSAVSEGILANEYLFTADGKSANHLEKFSILQTNN